MGPLRRTLTRGEPRKRVVRRLSLAGMLRVLVSTGNPRMMQQLAEELLTGKESCW